MECKIEGFDKVSTWACTFTICHSQKSNYCKRGDCRAQWLEVAERVITNDPGNTLLAANSVSIGALSELEATRICEFR